jgi:hypothetical protein
MPAVDRTEGPDHPAYLADPEANKYENGDTSSWAEDPHPPPYNQSPPPAMPGNGTTEDVTHPAHVPQSEVPATGPMTAQDADARAPKAASLQLKQAAEKKAALCVRIAQATLPGATVAEIEHKAMLLMDEPDAKIHAAADVLRLAADDEEDQDEASDEDDDAKMGGKDKKASRQIQALNKKVDRLVKAFGDFFGMDDLMDDGEVELDMMLEEDDMSDDALMAMLTNMADDMDGDGVDQSDNSNSMATEHESDDMEAMLAAMEDEAGDDMEMMSMQDEFDRGEESEGTEMYDEGEMLAVLMAELDGEGHMASDAELSVEPLAKGPTIQSGEGGNVNPEAAPVTPEVEQMDGSEKTANPAENDIAMSTGADPMGLMDEESVTASSNDDLLALYADLDLPKTAGDDDEDDDDDDDDDDDEEEVEVEEEVEEKEGSNKKASRQRPRPKKASKGPKTLGSVPQSKKAANEIAELSQIWDTAPDVREFFGIPK